MILHIPHSSVNTLGRNIEKFDIDYLTDWYTDELFQHTDSDRVVFDISRFVCDVERFTDDKEEMVKVGHGISYTKGTRNNDIAPIDKEEILSYYYKHHTKLNKLTAKTLAYFNSVVVVDCHSFPKDMSDFDFCIGFNEESTLNKEIIEYIRNNGYTVGVNSPYYGSLVPTNYINDSRVESVMIEVNKKLYLNEDMSKSPYFFELKKFINTILEIISKYEDRL